MKYTQRRIIQIWLSFGVILSFALSSCLHSVTSKKPRWCCRCAAVAALWFLVMTVMDYIHACYCRRNRKLNSSNRVSSATQLHRKGGGDGAVNTDGESPVGCSCMLRTPSRSQQHPRFVRPRPCVIVLQKCCVAVVAVSIHFLGPSGWHEQTAEPRHNRNTSYTTHSSPAAAS